MDTAIFFAVVSGLLQILGYIVYNFKVRKSGMEPDSASWGIWTFGSLMNMLSYATLTNDWVKDILPIACSVSCIVTFVIMLRRGQMHWPDMTGWMMFLVDLVITIIWYFTSATEASLLYQIGTVASYVPMVIGVKNGTDKEDPLPWFIWTLAYGIFMISVMLRLNNWPELAYPVTCFVVSGYMAWVVWNNRSH